MAGPKRPARSRGSPIRLFEASRLANDLIASAYDRILAAAARTATEPFARRSSPGQSSIPVVPSTGGRSS